MNHLDNILKLHPAYILHLWLHIKFFRNLTINKDGTLENFIVLFQISCELRICIEMTSCVDLQVLYKFQYGYYIDQYDVCPGY